jgi:(1->4)-alpha-D-glucan 1-alpha-D-glucosylmutase
VAYARSGRAITVVTRLAAALERSGGWGGATVSLPAGAWYDLLTDRTRPGGEVSVGDLLDRLPVCLLVPARKDS